jgi:16S rRNA (adenine1518-N6/adenine1519-N6)-dimethyltransferase
MSEEIPVQLVDDNDRPIGGGLRKDMHAKGLLHRVVRIMIVDEQNNVLVQKRKLDKRLFPGRWDNSAAGHVDVGEDYEEAIRREVAEELGISDISLREAAYYRSRTNDGDKILNRFTKLYEARMPRSTKMTLQESEVERVDWMTPAAVKRMISDTPEIVTDGLAETAEYWPLLSDNSL